MTDDAPKPLSAPGRDPPDRITISCFYYIARVTDVRRFASFFYGIIAHSELFAQGLDDESKKKFGEAAGEYKPNPNQEYSVGRQFINEMITSRALETFNLYIIMILGELFLKTPEMLKSEGQIDVATIIDMRGDFDGIISYVIDRKLHELGYKGLAKLAEYIESRTGIPLFRTDDILKKVLLLQEIRNLIAHNDCRKNKRFETQINADVMATLTVGESMDGGPYGGKVILSDDWVRSAFDPLHTVVFDFDEAVAKKHGLNTLNRMSSFLYRA